MDGSPSSIEMELLRKHLMDSGHPSIVPLRFKVVPSSLDQTLQCETTASLPHPFFLGPSTMDDMSNAFKIQTLHKNMFGTMKDQSSGEKLSKNQRAILELLFKQKFDMPKKIYLAGQYGITRDQVKSWQNEGQNNKKKNLEQKRIMELESEVKKLKLEIKGLKHKIESQTGNKQISVYASNNPGPSASQLVLEPEENLNSDDSE